MNAPTATARPVPLIVEGELIDLTAPRTRGAELAQRYRCRCGKDGSVEAHGGRTCNEVLAMRANMANTERLARLARPWLLAGGALAAVAGVGTAAVLLIVGVTTIAGMVAAVVAWLVAHGPALVAVVVCFLLLLSAGGHGCPGLHCGGCRG